MMYPLTHTPYINLSPTMKGNQTQILLMALTVKKEKLYEQAHAICIYLSFYIMCIYNSTKA